MLRKPTVFAGICCIAGALLAGCGGSSSPSHPSPTTSTPARQTPLMSNSDIGGAQPQSSRPAAASGQPLRGSQSTVRADRSTANADKSAVTTANADKSHITTAKVVQARQTPGSSNDDRSTTGAKPLNPCKLVSLSEAQTITGGATTKLTEAPLGPTCIYSGRGTSAAVTLTVEAARFSQVASHMTARKHVVVRGHSSVCGRLGTQMLFVPLGRYQLLHVTAPCGIAQRFAALAVSRLSA